MWRHDRGAPLLHPAVAFGQLDLHLVGERIPFCIVSSLNDPVTVPSILAPLSPQIQMIRVFSSSPSSSIALITRPTLWSAFSEVPGVHLHLSRVEGLQLVGHVVPCQERLVARVSSASGGQLRAPSDGRRSPLGPCPILVELALVLSAHSFATWCGA